ncbi:MAG: hypothetical protein V8R40_03600 [Dysosmobacter sp.]|nr:hypothetical protein [uncultured Oscillibacter sp.]
MKREVLYGGLLACGVALMVLSLVLEDHVSDSVGGMFMGAGCSLIGFGGSQFCMRHWEKKDPAAMRQAEIEANDERNVAIRRRAQAVSGEVLQWGVMAAAWLSIGLGAPLWVTLAAVGVFLAKSVLELCLMARYQREM